MTCTLVKPAADHPRECGANAFLDVDMGGEVGSSPRVRGKRRQRRRPRTQPRIIPASAGQTCGGVCVCAPSVGSSPRVRGKLAADLQSAPVGYCGNPPRVITLYMSKRPRCRPFWWLPRRLRIIPASAGQTQRADQKSSRHPDHPRECGANAANLLGDRTLFGSSPRVRGKRKGLNAFT